MKHAAATIEVAQLSKSFGAVQAVDQLSFSVQPGRVTGFLGPNGSGKTTTLRMLLGLVAPTSGSALIGGRRYAELPEPTRVVGAALEASSFHPGRSGRNHLRVQATAGGIDPARVDAVLQVVGMTDAADRRVGGYSLGMRQRLGLAAALLGDPQILILDEPTNGLDPEGIRWIRGFLRAMAAEGRTVLVSSHLLSEVQQGVDDVVIIARGRLVHVGDLASLSAHGGARVLVDAADRAALAAALQAAGLEVAPAQAGLAVAAEADRVGRAALAAGIALTHLSPLTSGLEQAFLDLTGGQR